MIILCNAKFTKNAVICISVISVTVFGVGEEKGVLIQKAIEALDLSSVVIVSPSASGIYSTPYILESHNHDKIAGYIPIAPVLPPQYTVDHFKELKVRYIQTN